MKIQQFIKTVFFFAAVILIGSGCKSEPKYLNQGSPDLVDISTLPGLTSSEGIVIYTDFAGVESKQLFAMNIDGSNSHQLASIENGVETPKVSPDGKLIAFIPSENSVQDLYVIASDGSGLRNLTNGQFPHIWVDSWSPDSRIFAFSVRDMQENEKWGLFTVNIETGEITQLIRDAGIAISASWSPDASQIALSYAANLITENGIYSMNSDGSNLRLLSKNLSHGKPPDSYPVWSPDGLRIAYTAGTIGDLFIMNADGSNILQYHSSSCKKDYVEPQWLPDNQHILVRCSRGNDPAILEVIDSYALSQPSIFIGEANHYYSLSPDGNYVIYSSPDSGVFITDINGMYQAKVSGEVPVVSWINSSGGNVNTEVVAQNPELTEKEMIRSACGNSFWPIVEGAEWDFIYTSNSGELSNVIYTISHLIPQSENDATFEMNGSLYQCDRGAIYSFSTGLVLPNETQIFNGNHIFDEMSGITYTVTGPKQISTYFDSYETFELCDITNPDICTSWSKDVGKVASTILDGSGSLAYYSIADEDSDADQSISAPQVQATLSSSTPTPETASISNTEGCNNPYWPIIQGAWWKYSSGNWASQQYSYTKTITSVTSSEGITYFTLQKVDSENTVKDHTYYCNENGIFDQETGYLLLPPEKLLTAGYQWSQPDGQQMGINFLPDPTVFTSVNLSKIVYTPYIGQNWWDYYAYGVGPAGWGGGEGNIELIEYYLPPVVQETSIPTTSTPETVSVSTAAGCNNPYWPIIQGAWWKYYVEKYSAESNPFDHYHTHTITSVTQAGKIIYFNIQIVDGLDNSITNKSYYCNEKGVYDQVTGYLLLPTERELTEGYRWFQQNGQQMAVNFIENSLGLLKLPKTAYISYVDQNNWDYYAIGIGPAGWAGGEHNLELADYYLPPIVQETPSPSTNSCTNPYWPITLGSSWAYDSNSGYIDETSTGIVQWEVIDLDMSSSSSTYFTIREFNSKTGEEKYSHYYCFDGGVYTSENILILPKERSLQTLGIVIHNDGIDTIVLLHSYLSRSDNLVVPIVAIQLSNNNSDESEVRYYFRDFGVFVINHFHGDPILLYKHLRSTNEPY